MKTGPGFKVLVKEIIYTLYGHIILLSIQEEAHRKGYKRRKRGSSNEPSAPLVERRVNTVKHPANASLSFRLTPLCVSFKS